jgi:rRNA-processing protein EBP2
MTRITEDFKLKGLPWIETMTITSSEPIVLEDASNDMARELAFYQQALEAAKLGRELVKKAGIDFTRPDDYFAEMLKSDEHMAKIRQRLLDESASIKASEDAKRQRQLKKFGKKVQVEKQLERQKQKTEMLDKIKLLKRSKFHSVKKRKEEKILTLNPIPN